MLLNLKNYFILLSILCIVSESSGINFVNRLQALLARLRLPRGHARLGSGSNGGRISLGRQISTVIVPSAGVNVPSAGVGQTLGLVIGEIVDLIGEAKAQKDNEDARKMLDLFFPVAVTMAGREQYVTVDAFNYESMIALSRTIFARPGLDIICYNGPIGDIKKWSSKEQYGAVLLDSLLNARKIEFFTC